MAIVEDELHNDSEEENEIEVVVEEDDQDSGDESDDDDDDEALETKVAELEKRIAVDPYNYDDHFELIQALWSLSELERWRAAFEALQQLSVLHPEHWLLRIQTELTLTDSEHAHYNMGDLFQQATLDSYSIPVLTEWCTWSLNAGSVEAIRAQIDEILRRAGADPLSGKFFWDAKTELERSQLEGLNEDSAEYKQQEERLLFSLEETVSRPLAGSTDVWPQLQELAVKLHSQEYADKIKKQHEAALEYLDKITPFEDRLLTMEDNEEKLKVYKEYIETVKELSQIDTYAECDSNGILKVLYDRATSIPTQSHLYFELLTSWVSHVRSTSSAATFGKVVEACLRRCPRRSYFWLVKMQLAEREGKSFEEVKSIFESAISVVVESYAQCEELWMCYLEYMRRTAQPTLRETFRLGWDTLLEQWGAAAADCELPVFWARLEYRRLGDPKQGKEIFEEIFKHGENKTLSKYWETFIHLETTKTPALSENKTRDLYKRAMKFITDYPPAVAKLWTDFERDFGALSDVTHCKGFCEKKLLEWRQNYQAMKEKMGANKYQKGKYLQKKPKFDKNKPENQKFNPKDKSYDKSQDKSHDKSHDKCQDKSHDKSHDKSQDKPQDKSDEKVTDRSGKGKRKMDDSGVGSEVKKKRDSGVVSDEGNDSGAGVKRSHGDEEAGGSGSKRVRTDSGSSDPGSRQANTLFVSNLEFKVNEQDLRDKLSQYGDIMSLRVRSGVKAFGGSICYCQYKTPEAVTEALKHDRTPLNGRPMFLSRYADKNRKQQFKYSTDAEKNKLFVKNLPYDSCTKEALTELFDKYGRLKDVRAVTFKDGKPKGLAYVEYETESDAATALAKTHGLLVGDRRIDVAVSAPPKKQDPDAASLGAPKRDTAGGMRRTQLSSFIPSVVQKAMTTSAAVANGSSSSSGANTNSGSQTNGGEQKRPMSNSDFRNMLLKK